MRENIPETCRDGFKIHCGWTMLDLICAQGTIFSLVKIQMGPGGVFNLVFFRTKNPVAIDLEIHHPTVA